MDLHHGGSNERLPRFEAARRLLLLSRGLAVASVLLWIGSEASAEAAYTFLGFPSYVIGVSADGEVIAGGKQFFSPPPAGFFAMRSSSSGAITRLAGLPIWSSSLATSASSDGSKIAGLAGGTLPPYKRDAVLWTAGGGVSRLGSLAFGTDSEAHAISADGTTLVGWSDNGVAIEAFVWTSGAGMVGLGFLPGGTESRAYGVSEDGSTVVGECTTASGTEAFLWTSGGGMVGLGDLPGGAFGSVAHAISSDGTTVVGKSFSAASGVSYPEAFVWTSDAGMVGLGDLPGGPFSSTAHAVSADGSVVVGASAISPGAGGDTAFYWTAANGLRSMDVVVDEAGLVVEPGDYAEAAFGISGDGLVVVGLGSSDFNSGDQEGWILDLSPAQPLPVLSPLATAALVAVMIGAVHRRMRRPPLGSQRELT